MKKTICNYTYDTEIGNIVKKVTSGFFGDPKGYEKTLYAMPDGKMFFYVNGGSKSPFTKEDIKRVSQKEAEKWIKEN